MKSALLPCLPFWLLLVLNAALNADVSAAQASHWYLTGSIGSYPVQMDLTVEGNGRIDGSYLYQKGSSRLELQGSLQKGGVMAFAEYVETEFESGPESKPKPTGMFHLMNHGTGGKVELQGTWQAAGQKKPLPVTLRASIVFQRVYQSAEISSLYVERPVFLDGFKNLFTQPIPDTKEYEVLEEPEWDGGHGIRFEVHWHQPDNALSLLRVESENVGGEGKADYGYQEFHYRLVDGQIVRLRLQDFFRPGNGWRKLLEKKARLGEDSERQFTFDASGLSFHGYEWKDRDEAKISWKALEDVLKPGWPQQLGINPTELYTTPDIGSDLREAILKAAAAATVKEYVEANFDKGENVAEFDIVWQVDDLRVKDGWALLVAKGMTGLKGSREVFGSESERHEILLRQQSSGKWETHHIIAEPVYANDLNHELEGVPVGLIEGLTTSDPEN